MRSVKYEHDILRVTGILMILKNWENNGTEEIGLVTPTPDLDGRALHFELRIFSHIIYSDSVGRREKLL